MLVSAAETATISRVHMPQPHREMSARLCWSAGTLLQSSWQWCVILPVILTFAHPIMHAIRQSSMPHELLTGCTDTSTTAHT